MSRSRPRWFTYPLARLRGAFSLPRAWAWGSAAILAVALAALLLPQRARRALGEWRSWRQGALRKDGMITFEDGPSVPCPYGTTLKPGPVVLLRGAVTTEAGPFRAANVAPTPERDDLRQGTIAEVVASFEAEIDARHAYATAASLMAAAPWVAALIERLIPERSPGRRTTTRDPATPRPGSAGWCRRASRASDASRRSARGARCRCTRHARRG